MSPKKGYKRPPRSEEWCKNISRAKIEKHIHFSEDSKTKMSLSHKGFKHTEETKKKLSLLLKGRPSSLKGTKRSKEFRRKVSLAKIGNKNPFFGKHHTEESKKKISLVGIGNKYSLGRYPSEETRKKLVISHTGKHTAKLGTKASPEARKNLSIYQKKFCQTPEGKAKIKRMQMAAKVNISNGQKHMYNYLKKEFTDAILQYEIWTGKTWRFADVGIPSLKLDFEFDGYFCNGWHSKEKDLLRDKELVNVGWKTIRITEEDLAFLLGTSLYFLRRKKA
jgi:hypothetical protein